MHVQKFINKPQRTQSYLIRSYLKIILFVLL